MKMKRPEESKERIAETFYLMKIAVSGISVVANTEMAINTCGAKFFNKIL